MKPVLPERSECRAVEMHHIRYFLAVSETLNLTKAAERCNVAQPALSRAIQALENELGGELLRRERALSHLTELGQRVLPMLRQSYETAVAAKMLAASIRNGEDAPLSVAVSHTIALSHFTTTLRELSRAFPGLQLKLRRGSGNEVAEFLKSGAAELAIAGPLKETWLRGLRSPIWKPCSAATPPALTEKLRLRVTVREFVTAMSGPPARELTYLH
jgi:DNA-binding transcriptional LysR family regulator